MYMCFMGNGYAYKGALTPHNLSCGFWNINKNVGLHQSTFEVWHGQSGSFF